MSFPVSKDGLVAVGRPLPVGKIKQLTPASDHGWKRSQQILDGLRARRAFVRSKALRIRVQSVRGAVFNGQVCIRWSWRLIKGEDSAIALSPRYYSTRGAAVRSARALAKHFTPDLQVAVFP